MLMLRLLQFSALVFQKLHQPISSTCSSSSGSSCCAFVSSYKTVPTPLRRQAQRQRQLPLPSSSSPRHHLLFSTSTGTSSSSSSGDGNFQEQDDDDQNNHWEQLYQQGEARRNHSAAIMDPSATTTTTTTTSSIGAAEAAAGPMNIPGNRNTNAIRVVTFDLDNTLWNTGATIAAANDALAQFLTTHNIQQSKRTEDIMKGLFLASKETYCPLLHQSTADNNNSNNKAAAPVLLTQLRKDALKQILVQDNGYSQEDAADFAERAFRTWMEARYKAIPSHYASDVIAVLDNLSRLHLRRNHPNRHNGNHKSEPIKPKKILVGAITDGNSDPRNIPELEPYFDFCVNAEQVGVSKPDKRVFLKAATDHVFSSRPSLFPSPSSSSPLLLQEENNNSNNNNRYYYDDDGEELPVVEDLIGQWWVHIGDDFTKDVVAAKSLNMRTVWARELVLDKKPPKEQPRRKPPPANKPATNNSDIASLYNNNDNADDSNADEKSSVIATNENPEGSKNNDNDGMAKKDAQLTPEQELMEFQKKINSQTVVKMAVGADDFLASSIQKEFADAIIGKFSDLTNVLEEWHDMGCQQQQQQQRQQARGQSEITDSSSSTIATTTTTLPSAPVDPALSRPTSALANNSAERDQLYEVGTEEDAVSLSKTKFCVFCGTRLPSVAIFCSSCSKKQPPIS